MRKVKHDSCEPRSSGSLTPALGLIVILPIEIDRAESFKDPELLAMLNVLFERGRHRFPLGPMFPDPAGFFN